MKLKYMIIVAGLSTVIAAGSAFAFSGTERSADPAKRAEYLQKRLQLSTEQQQKVQQLFEKSEQQRGALERKYTIADRAKFRDEVRTLYDTQKQGLEALLMPAQREAMLAQKERHGMHGKRDRGDWSRSDRGPRGEPMPKAEKPAK